MPVAFLRRWVVRQAGTGRDQAADDHVFLQAAQGIAGAADTASVSTRVVSWNEAAEMNDSVASEALVMPSSRARPADRFALGGQAAFVLDPRWRSACSPARNLLSPESVISTFCAASGG